MTDPLTAHASPSDTSFSRDWQEDRPQPCESFGQIFRDGKKEARASRVSVQAVDFLFKAKNDTKGSAKCLRHLPDSATGTKLCALKNQRTPPGLAQAANKTRLVNC